MESVSITRLERAALLFLFLGLLATPVAAQDACETVLREAEKDYFEGRLEEVFALKEICLGAKSTTDQRIQAHALLAKVHLALDQLEKARAEVRSLLTYKADFQPDERRDPVPFVALVAELKVSEAVVTVASVSKFDEPLREAPATVFVITADQIQERGYVDLEQILHDLPGFDISRGRGLSYSNIYQRGFRSDDTDRTLFLIDGIEQNDLWSNAAPISRQYPLSNVDRVEVVYGPASTIYGANAYTGVINVISKNPADRIKPGHSFGGGIEIGAGSFNTRFLEFDIAGRSKKGSLTYSITARSYLSDEPDLSGFEDWDYELALFDRLSEESYRRSMSIIGAAAIQGFLEQGYGPPGDLFYFETDPDDPETVLAIRPTETAILLARDLDKEHYLTNGFGVAPRFSNETKDWFLNARIDVPNLTFGMQVWGREEGSVSAYTDLDRDGYQHVWYPRAMSFYAKYSRRMNAATSLQLFSRYTVHDLGDSSSNSFYSSYGGGGLNVEGLALGFTPGWLTLYFKQTSHQFRNELSLLWEPSRNFNLVSGIELRNSSIQADLDRYFDPDEYFLDFGSASLNATDLGFFSQMSWRLRNHLKLVAGGRVDHNTVAGLGGYGTVFNPRLAIVYAPGSLVFKAIYAEAFKDPSNSEKFGTNAQINEIPSDGLEPERVTNIELSGSWQPADDLAIELSAYEAKYSNVVGLREVPNVVGTTGQKQNLGKLEVRGVQLSGSFRRGIFKLLGNYTFAEPFNTNPLNSAETRLRIGDIASHRSNLDLTVSTPGSFSFNLRANYVGERKTGPGTTVATNPFPEVAAYTVVHGTLTYEVKSGAAGRFRGSRVQLGFNNILDKEYADPGIGQAGVTFAARLPQPGRTLFLRFTWVY